jgi:putative heme-binding domain-containing protein
LLKGNHPQAVQLAAVAALDRFSEPEVAAVLVDAWRGLSPRLRTAAAEALFSRPERAAAFLDAMDSGTIRPADTDPGRLNVLRQSSDAAVREKAEKLAAKLKSGARPEVLQAYRPALTLTGDPAKGKALFQKTCAACHRLDGFGTEIGPNLIAMQNRGPDAILANVIDPNLEVNPQFVEYLVDTKDGRTLTGLLASESANSVTLKRSEGATDTVLRGDIAKMRSTGLSIMPEGLEQQLDVQAMADLIAYLMVVK